MADVDRIIKERRRGGLKQYLCTWFVKWPSTTAKRSLTTVVLHRHCALTGVPFIVVVFDSHVCRMDGAEPQWVAAEYLEGSTALEEWEEADAEIAESFDPDDVLAQKVAQVAAWIRSSRRTCWLVGAGLSSSVLPTFRGGGGLWTRGAGMTMANLKSKGKAASESSSSSSSSSSVAAAAGTTSSPTPSHRALVALEKAGYVTWLASQNYDDLLHHAGFPDSKLSELHGNIYKERCSRCGAIYHRSFEVELQSAKDHETGRSCERAGCSGALRDSLVHFGESLPWRDLSLANAKFVGCDVALALGTSLRVEPAASLAFKAKRRSRRPDGELQVRSVIVNLQPTPRDSEADLVIRARTDDFLRQLMTALGVAADMIQ